MSLIASIIALILIAIIESEEKRKNAKPRIIGYRSVTGEPIFDKPCNEKPIGYDIHTGQPIYAGENHPVEPPKVINKVEDKTRITNSVLMITGAVLIVFASIIFLATSWEVLPGLVKTFILIVLQAVFFLFSYICFNIFHIEKTAKLFKHLAFLFVPIVLLSLSCFNLVGSYLSIDGEGYLLFFGISFIISCSIFYIFGVFTNDKTLCQMGYILGLIGVLLVALNFIDDSTLPVTIVAIINIILYVIIEYNLLNKEMYSSINNITNYVIIGLLIVILSLDGASYATNLGLLLYSIYYYLKYHFEQNETKQRRFTIYYLGLYVFSLSILNKVQIPSYFLYMIALMPLLLLTKIVKKDLTKNIITYGILIMSALVSLVQIPALINAKSGEEIYFLLTYILGFILHTITYLVTKKGYAKTLAYISFTAIFMDVFYIVDLKDYIKYIPLVTIVLTYFLEILFDKLKDESSNVYFPFMIILESILLLETYAVLIPLIFMIIYIKIEKKDEALLIVPMLMSLSLFTMEKTIYSQIVCCLLIVIYSILSLNKKTVSVYTVVSFLSIFAGNAAFDFHKIVFSLLLLVWSASHLFLNKDNGFYKFATATSTLILYINTVNVLDLELQSLYLLGFYLYLIALTQFIFKGSISDLKFIDCFGIVVITLVGLELISGVTDAIIIIFTLLIVIILAFIKKWNHILYTSLICLIINIIYLTWEFWTQVPWYIYILIVGLALIGFAMFDEKRKQDKKKLQAEQPVKNEDMK